MKNGKLLVFEGLDGSGKTTQAKSLARLLSNRGHEVYLTAEPTNTLIGGYVREILNGSIEKSNEFLASLLLADRINHNVDPNIGILKHIEQGHIVICDRYFYSNFVYQGINPQEEQWIIEANLLCPAIYKPELCIFIDIEPEKAMDRLVKQNGYKDTYENIEKLQEVAQRYRHILNVSDQNTVVVDGASDQQTVSTAIAAAVTKFLGIG